MNAFSLDVGEDFLRAIERLVAEPAGWRVARERFAAGPCRPQRA